MSNIREIDDDMVSFEWKISGLFPLKNERNYYTTSGTFSLCGVDFYLSIWLNRNTADDTVGWVSLYLNRLKASYKKHHISYTLGIRRRDGTSFKSFSKISEFQETDDITHNGYGEPKFVRTSDLQESKDVVSFNNSLAVYCIARDWNARPKHVIDVRETGSQTERSLKNHVPQATQTEETNLSGPNNQALNIRKEQTSPVATSRDTIETYWLRATGFHSKVDKLTGSLRNYVQRGSQTEETNISETIPTKLLGILSSNYEKLYEDKTDTDCVLKAGDTQFPVHRTVLSARSSVFAAMFHHDTSESSSGEANIQDVEAATLNDVLYYVYSGKIRGLTSDTAVSMFTVADRYAILELREECLQFLLQNLTISNICEAAVLAHTHGEEILENKVVCFIDGNLKQVMDSDEWKEFFATKTLIAGKFLSAAYLASKTHRE